MLTDPRLGTELAGYRIESLIGRGGMSVVYLAEHLRLKRKAALKLVAPELASDPKFRERFLRESELAASLDHPNIIPIYDADEADGLLYIAMRYVEGTDVKALIQSGGAMAPGKTLSIVSQAGRALDAAHAKGLVHRDVKSSNILLASGPGEDIHVYLSDFGLTKRMTSDSGLTATGQFVGTLDYAAPEQFEGKPLDGRTDIYSLGCVLYECLTGEVPFKGENEAALVYAHLLKPPPKATALRPELPAAIDDVVSTAMAKDPRERFPDCRTLSRAVQAALLPPPGSDPQTRWGTAGSRLARRGRLPMALVAGAVLIVAIVVGAMLLRHGGKGSEQTATIPRAGVAIRIDPVTRRVVGRIPVGPDPSGVAVGEGSAWVTDGSANTLLRIDPVTGKVITIRVGKEPESVALSEGAVWVVNNLDHSVMRVDPSTNRVTATITPGFALTGVAAGPEGVWIGTSVNVLDPAHPALALRVDPKTNAVVAMVPIPGTIQALSAVGEGAVWVGGSDGTVTRIDPSTNAAVKTVVVGRPVGAVVVGDGAVWVTSDSSPAIVWRIDPSSDALSAPIAVGGTPSAAAEGAGLLWIAEHDDRVLAGVLSISNDVLDPIKLGVSPTGVAVGEGSIWVVGGPR